MGILTILVVLLRWLGDDRSYSKSAVVLVVVAGIETNEMLFDVKSTTGLFNCCLRCSIWLMVLPKTIFDKCCGRCNHGIDANLKK